MRVVAVIPAYNEEEAITGVVQKVRKYCHDVIVVDDGSKDRTAEVLADLGKQLGVKYVVHKENLGQGAATRTGIAAALALGADIIVTLDGDGQHDTEQIPDLLAPLLPPLVDVDIVIGSRFLRETTTPQYRRFGIQVITWMFNIGSRQKLSDSLLCFRAFRRSVFEHVRIEEDGFGFCPEVLIKARQQGFRIKEIPANCTYYREYRRNSTFGPFKLAAILVWKTLLWRARIERHTMLLGDRRLRLPWQTVGKGTPGEVRGS